MLEIKPNALRTRIVTDEGILGGTPCVSGTRVPAETVLSYLRAGYTDDAIREDYPSLPLDGIEAVMRWAQEQDTGLRPQVEAASSQD